MQQTPSGEETSTVAKVEITGDIMIADLVDNFPEVVDYLINEYGFHCVSCFVSSFECLEDGAKVHGIDGDDFAELLANVNALVNGSFVYEA